MAADTLDKKRSSNGAHLLFSSIQKLDPDLQASRSIKEKKALEYNYGFVGFIAAGNRNTSNYSLVIQGVYKESSVDKEGLKRGMGIIEIDNQKITAASVQACYSKLIKPSSPTSIKVKDKGGKVYTIDSGPIYANPIIHHQIKGKTGYLVYSVFESGLDQELSDVFKEFRSQNIIELILDLCYNGGRDVTSTNPMSSCVARDFCVDKTFTSHRYNDKHMKALGNQWSIQKFMYSQYDNPSTPLSTGDLKLQKIYCLVIDDSASANELVINALGGIDIEAILISTTTHGKNVGMEGAELTARTDRCLFFPITFQAYNAKSFRDFENSFTPDYEINENQPNGEHSEGCGDLGTEGDPLYAKAINLISGSKATAPTRAVNQAKKQMLAIAAPGLNRIGMIK